MHTPASAISINPHYECGDALAHPTVYLMARRTKGYQSITGHKHTYSSEQIRGSNDANVALRQEEGALFPKG